VLEKAFQLVEVAVGDRQEAGRIGVAAVGASDGANIDLKLLAKALHAPTHAHELAPLEASGEHVGVAKGAGEDRAGPVAQLERQIGAARTRDLAFLARAGEHPVDVLAEAQRSDCLVLVGRGSRRGGHPCMMYGGSDAAAHLGPPSGRPPRPCHGVRFPGVERRRRRRLERRVLPGLLARRPPLREVRLGGVLRLPG
jgi:hypothetical protein